MIETPLLDELLAETKAGAVLHVLEVRLGPVPQDLQMGVRAIHDLRGLDELLTAAAECDGLAAFRARLHS